MAPNLLNSHNGADISHTLIPWYSLFVLRVPLNTSKPTKHPIKARMWHSGVSLPWLSC